MSSLSVGDRAKRRAATAVALAGLAMVAGCGSDADGAESAEGAASPPGASTPSGASRAGGAAGGSATSVLTGTVGSEADPDAFVIGLTDSTGAAVTTLPAGTYSIALKDLSEIHNFHLEGGSIDETTTVPEVTDKSVEVTLTPGEYTYTCDPHQRMTGTFTVT